MKILHVITNTTFNIYYSTINNLLKSLHQNSIEQNIIYDSESLNGAFPGISSLHVPYTKNIFGFNFKLFFSINKFNPDIVITWGELARNFIGNTKYPHLSFVESISNMKSFSVCDYIFTNSENILNFLKKNGWSGNRSIYLPPLIQNADWKKITKKDLYIPEHSKVIFSSTGFFKAINTFPLFRAISFIPELYLILTGHGPNINEVREDATKAGVKPRIRIINNVNNINGLLNISEFSIFPFFDMEIKLSILSSFKNKKLVIADQNYLTKEIIKDNYNGIMLYSTEYANIANIIQKNLTDKSVHEEFINNAYNDYNNLYQEAKIIKQYINIFQKIIDDCKMNLQL